MWLVIITDYWLKIKTRQKIWISNKITMDGQSMWVTHQIEHFLRITEMSIQFIPIIKLVIGILNMISIFIIDGIHNKQHFMAPNCIVWYSSSPIKATNILIMNKYVYLTKIQLKSFWIALHSNDLLGILGQSPILLHIKLTWSIDE